MHVTNPKPEPWKRVKRRRKRLWQQERERVREAQWEKDGRCCAGNPWC